MRILVTGAAGFIGSSVAERLLARGDEVVGYDNLDPFYDPAIKRRNLAALAARPGFTFVEADILDQEALADRTGDLDAAVHLAAVAGVRPSLGRPQRYMRVNVEGTVNVLETLRRRGVRRFVVASSSSVYGAGARAPFSEEDPCLAPASPYAASKRAAEIACDTLARLHGLSVTALRYFTVYGPRQRPEMAIHKFVRLASRGEPIPLFGDGSSGRDYTYIDDIVAGTLAALDRLAPGFRVYNLGGSRPVRLAELVEAIGRALGREVAVAREPWQLGDVPLTSADITRAARDLGYAPRVPLDEGLARFVRWYRDVAAATEAG